MDNLLHLAIVDDNPQVLDYYQDILNHDFKLTTFANFREGLEYLKNHPVDALLLDLHLPETNGFEVFKEIKSFKPDLVVLFLTAESEMKYKVEGLKLGADDFISKPFDVEELKARILNRIQLAKKSKTSATRFQVKDLIVDVESHEVSLKGKKIKLTPKEFQIIYLLAQKPNKVIPKEDFINLLWKGEAIEVNNIDTHFSNLRKKLSPFSDYIKTLKNLGYVLRV